jgi:hypothetical protein
MYGPDDLGPALPVRRPRRLWVRAVALVMALTIVVFPFNWAFSPGFVDERCPSPLVRDYGGTCTSRDRLVVLTNDGQDRASVVAAIAPFGGQIDFDLGSAGIYGVRFPVTKWADLAPIRLALQAAGFSVSYDFHNGELFAQH